MITFEYWFEDFSPPHKKSKKQNQKKMFGYLSIAATKHHDQGNW